MAAYYNEIDPFAAAWLRELIKEGLIASGDVDERSIADVRPSDLSGYRQCHFFAGIGAWSYALRTAGVPDDEPVWTGSCPCQPFSAAGKGGGFDDERHLWPDFHWLIAQCRPHRVLGEQVASKDGLSWFDLVSADLEGTGYACGAVDTCAAGVGAPHIRQRLYWTAERLADAGRERDRTYRHHMGKTSRGKQGQTRERERIWFDDRASGDTCGLAHGHHEGLEGRGQPGRERAAERPAGASGVAGGLADAECERTERRVEDQERPSDARSERERELLPTTRAAGRTGGVADAARSGRREERADAGWEPVGNRAQGFAAGLGTSGVDLRPGPVNGLWRDADWLLCRDGRWRPVEPGTFLLAHGAPARVGRLRGYGNAINAAQAAAFIEAVFGTEAQSADDAVQLRASRVT